MRKRGQAGSALKKRRTKQKNFAKLLDIKQPIKIVETHLGGDVWEQRNHMNVNDGLITRYWGALNKRTSRLETD